MRPYVLQKDDDRYTFITTKMPDGKCRITHERLAKTGIGCYLAFEYYTEKGANDLYRKLISEGYKRFRSWGEVSWYATTENNTPYPEEWTTEGIWFVPIKSRVLSN